MKKKIYTQYELAQFRGLDSTAQRKLCEKIGIRRWKKNVEGRMIYAYSDLEASALLTAAGWTIKTVDDEIKLVKDGYIRDVI